MSQGTEVETMITTLSGPNGYMLGRALENKLSDFKDDYGDLAIEQIDGLDNDYQTIIDSLLNLPFLTTSKLVILRTPSANKQFSEGIDKILSDIPETNDVVIVEPSIDKRSKYYKLLKQATDYKSFEELDVSGLTRWIIELVHEKGGQITPIEASYLVELLGINQLRISNEITKLLSYKPQITKETIDKLVEPIPQTTIFQLLDAAFAGKREETLKIYEDQRRQKVEPQQIIAMLTWQLNSLALIKAAEGLPPAQISLKTKLSPFVVSKNLTITRKLSMGQIKALISELLELDLRLKSQSVDPDDTLIQFLLSI